MQGLNYCRWLLIKTRYALYQNNLSKESGGTELIPSWLYAIDAGTIIVICMFLFCFFVTVCNVGAVVTVVICKCHWPCWKWIWWEVTLFHVSFLEFLHTQALVYYNKWVAPFCHHINFYDFGGLLVAFKGLHTYQTPLQSTDCVW